MRHARHHDRPPFLRPPDARPGLRGARPWLVQAPRGSTLDFCQLDPPWPSPVVSAEVLALDHAQLQADALAFAPYHSDLLGSTVGTGQQSVAAPQGVVALLNEVLQLGVFVLRMMGPVDARYPDVHREAERAPLVAAAIEH